MENVVIIVPLYKSSMNYDERISFDRLIKILSSYTICLISYKGLNLDEYTSLLEKSKVNYYIVFFKKTYFKGVYSYNFLMLSKRFYKKFERFQYLYIYQLDVYVFKDELSEWCKKGYDYIGAPVYKEKKFNFEMTNNFNGGASLRNVEHFINAYNMKWLILYTKLISRYLPQNWFLRICKISITFLHGLLAYISIPIPLKLFKAPHEDILWSSINGFNYPSVEEASDFAFEEKPKTLFEKTGKLPFCCHAWRKFEYDTFWRKYISELEN